MFLVAQQQFHADFSLQIAFEKHFLSIQLITCVFREGARVCVCAIETPVLQISCVITFFHRNLTPILHEYYFDAKRSHSLATRSHICTHTHTDSAKHTHLQPIYR